VVCIDVYHLTSHSYDFEYEDDDEEQGGDVDIENKYYNAKQLKVDDPEGAVDEFLGVPALEEEKGDWYVGATTLHG
jgi:COP9 signalosome complex subunit 2